MTVSVIMLCIVLYLIKDLTSESIDNIISKFEITFLGNNLGFKICDNVAR